jgi:signal peptidase I
MNKKKPQSTEKVPSYIVIAIISFFFFWPTAIVAIIYASKVNALISAGDIVGAKKASRIAKLFSCWTIGIVTLLYVIFFILSQYVFKMYIVPDSSMSPTIKANGYVRVETYDKNFKRNDIVLFDYQSDNGKNISYVKRIIGAPGDQVKILDEKVYLNGELLNENYIEGSYTAGDISVTLGADQYYVLSDNRDLNSSVDSRNIGPISKSQIIGKVW